MRLETRFAPLPAVPDHAALERDILALWEDEGTFFKLRDRNRGGPTFSFMDGPITANGPAGVQHLGRVLKDVFQRYKALRGYDQRYQNGFDCQGLSVEVEVEKEQSKRLGQWMDWDNDYYTFSDTNIEYIWMFLKEVHSRGWLYKGHRSTQWCPR